MKINSIYNSPDDITLESYLKKCGVTDVSEYVIPQGKYIEQWDTKSITDAEKVLKAIDDNYCFVVQDSDVDGICSAVIAYQFLKHIGKKTKDICVLFHTSKQHGLKDMYKTIIEKSDNLKKPYFIWCPDASTNDVNECEILHNRGARILVTDHHGASVNGCIKGCRAVVVNNQLEKAVKNKNLCGTGVTYKVIEKYCKTDRDTWYKNLLDMVALANIADVMDMNNYENRTFNYYGLRRIKNSFLKFLCEVYIKDDITPKSLAFNIIPKLNAVCRSHNQILKANIFKAFVGIKNDYKNLVRDINSCYNQQRRYVSDKFEEYKKTIDNECCNNDVIVFYGAEKSSYTGLIATKLSDYYAKPVIIVYFDSNTKTWRGSCRSPVDFRDILDKSGVMLVCIGHKKAFGVEWKDDVTAELISYIQNLSLDIHPYVDVLCSCTVPELSDNLFSMGYDYRELWGHGIEEPKYHLKEIVINGTDIKEIGTNGIKFDYGFTSFIKFGLSKDTKDKLYVGKDINIKLEVIGYLSLNEWNGNIKKQVVMERIVVV